MVLLVDNRDQDLFEFVTDHLYFGHYGGADGLVKGVVGDRLEDVVHAEAVQLGGFDGGAFGGSGWQHFVMI